ncbi:MAG: type II toxin-antitoxin system PemK/MazF family toxin [Candidatus Woesearchaeota archaeon]
MEGLMKGDIVVIQFPFSDIESSKRRPALVVAKTNDENQILCQITSQDRPDPDKLSLKKFDFQQGCLKHESYIRPTILFTLHNSRISYKIGKLIKEKIRIVENKFCEIFTR